MKKTPKQKAEELKKYLRSRYAPCLDHIHWTIINGTPLFKGMGTTHDSQSKNNGKIELIGRNSSGWHQTIYGPVTQRHFWSFIKHFTAFGPKKEPTI